MDNDPENYWIMARDLQVGDQIEAMCLYGDIIEKNMEVLFILPRVDIDYVLFHACEIDNPDIITPSIELPNYRMVLVND